jgi:hypothetical protein
VADRFCDYSALGLASGSHTLTWLYTRSSHTETDHSTEYAIADDIVVRYGSAGGPQ